MVLRRKTIAENKKPEVTREAMVMPGANQCEWGRSEERRESRGGERTKDGITGNKT